MTGRLALEGAERLSSSGSAGSSLREQVRSVMASAAGFAGEEIVVVDAVKAGNRMKVAVAPAHFGGRSASYCVGVGGTRAADFTERLGAVVEFVDFDPDPQRYVAAALNVPVLAVSLDTAMSPPRAVVVVDPQTYPIAVGKSGANVRMAGLLTGLVVTICTPACRAHSHHHPVGLRPTRSRPRHRRGQAASTMRANAATPTPQRSLALPPLPAHVLSERANRRRRTR